MDSALAPHTLDPSVAVAQSPLFAKLSAELRTQIWTFALSEEHFIDFTARGVDEPGLLSVCHAVRNETKGLWYHENGIHLVCDDYDSSAIIKAEEKLRSVDLNLRDFLKASRSTMTNSGKRSLHNLAIWVKHVHAGETNFVPVARLDAGRVEEEAVNAIFEMVSAMRLAEWDRMHLLLVIQVPVLVHCDKAWADEIPAGHDLKPKSV